MSENNNVSAEAWNEELGKDSGVTTEELDLMAQQYQAAYDEYEKSKDATSALKEQAEKFERELLAKLEAAGKSKYFVEGIGTFYFIDKMSVQTPKTNADKAKVFDYITKKYGQTVLMAKISIVSATLNSFYKEEFEQYAERAKAAQEKGEEFTEVFGIPGLQEPTNRRSLGLRTK